MCVIITNSQTCNTTWLCFHIKPTTHCGAGYATHVYFYHNVGEIISPEAIHEHAKLLCGVFTCRILADNVRSSAWAALGFEPFPLSTDQVSHLLKLTDNVRKASHRHTLTVDGGRALGCKILLQQFYPKLRDRKREMRSKYLTNMVHNSMNFHKL